MKKSKLLSLIFAASSIVALAACSSDPTKKGNAIEDPTTEKVSSDTLHDVKITENKVRAFVKNGYSEYKIVYGETLEGAAARAAGYIQGCISSATGVNLERVPVESIGTIVSGDKYILVGCENKFAEAGFSLDGLNLASAGYRVVTKENNCFIAANKAEGYHLAGLAFLRAVLGYDMISEDTVIYTKKGDTLPDMDITERPDFEYRLFTNCLSNTDLIYGTGFNPSGSLFIPFGGAGVHNCLKVLPSDTYYGEHPLWYSGPAGSSQQLCYTAHGDNSEREAMLNTVYEKLKIAVADNPNMNNITFTQEDTPTCCTCDECNRFLAKYGSVSSTILGFVNDLDDRLQADIKAGKIPGRDGSVGFHIYFFAYNATIDAPTAPEGEKPSKYTQGNENVGVIVAPIAAAFTKSFNHPDNAKLANLVNKWGKICNHLCTWLYECNFKNYMYIYNSFENLIENYRFCKNANASFMYNQGIRQNTASTAFVRFREYLASKAQFDLRVKYGEVRDTFFENYFREASPIMMKLFNQMTQWETHLEETESTLNGGIYELIEKTEWWPSGLLKDWLKTIDNAYEAVAKYKASNPSLYKTLCDHINLESLFPRYVLYKLHGSLYNDIELRNIRLEFKKDCEYFGITQDLEQGSITALWKSWGID
ncbi:MAG: DUF4838 domain-containing protein [Bacilli bacterium]|nr:DUF4838 domain-containing protein [Bacilli bacterium]